MDDHNFFDIFNPELIWGYNYRNRVSHFRSKSGNYKKGDYQLLVHPDDAQELMRLIVENVKEQRRLIQHSRQLLSLHRVRDSSAVYHRHISFIVLVRDDNNRLLHFMGADWLIDDDAPLSVAELRYGALLLRNFSERLGPFLQWMIDNLTPSPSPMPPTPQPRPVNSELSALLDTFNSEAFSPRWRCGNYFVAPSLYKMVRVSDKVTISFSEIQAKFIALLLWAPANGDKPGFVSRNETLRYVFGDDPTKPSSPNRKDSVYQLARFFRRHLPPFAIKTQRNVGHSLRIKRHICTGDELEHAEAML